MKVVFMGTPDFAVPVLEKLIEHHEVVGVITQPDKPKGRGKTMAMPPVKELALTHDIPVYQPIKVRESEFLDTLEAIGADVIVVAAFGQILPERIINMPPYGCINVHASLLPKYRGAAPIQWSIIDGCEETGVTIMYMEKGLDTGDMIDRAVVKIDPKETGDSLHDKLSAAGGDLIIKALADIEAGTAKREKQDDSLSCYAKMLTKELGQINWKDEAVVIERLIRGLNSWPSAYTGLDGKVLKIWDADVVCDPDGQYADAVPGTVVRVDKKHIYIRTGKDLLALNEVQLTGKKRMPVSAFLLGYKIETGTVL